MMVKRIVPIIRMNRRIFVAHCVVPSLIFVAPMERVSMVRRNVMGNLIVSMVQMRIHRCVIEFLMLRRVSML